MVPHLGAVRYGRESPTGEVCHLRQPEPHPDLAQAQLFGLVQELAHLGVWYWEIEPDQLTWSRELYRIYGLAPSEFEPCFAGYLERVHADDRERVRRVVQEALETETGGRFAFEERIVRADGAVRVLESMGTVVRDEHGAPVRMVGACMDVTERRATQLQLAERDQLSAIGTLAAGIAHELNNPLFYVRANLARLRELLTEPLAPDIDELLVESLQGLDRTSRIVSDLRAHVNEGGGGPTEVGPLVERVLKLVGHELEHRARVRLDVDPSIAVAAPSAPLKQVLLNLLTNAVRAIPSGRASENLVQVTVQRKGDEAIVTISDTGVGLPDGSVTRLFEPFFTTRRVGDGTGLGLFIAHRVVTGLGGRIALESRERGARATVWLPLARGDVPPAVPAVGRKPSRGARVLVIDDDPLVGRALARMLLDHDVTVTTSIAEAEEELASGLRPDLVLCDLMMPDGMGHELYARIEEQWPDLAPRVRFVTGGAFSDEVTAFVEAHAERVLYKPFDKVQLLALLESVVRRGPYSGQ